MRVFISHSWNDKTEAMRLRDDLKPITDLAWIDIQNLKPGDRIQEEIGETLKDMDLVLVLWSKHAAASAGVAPEIDKSVELGKRIIPCTLDDTELAGGLKGLIAIDFRDYAFGFGRLCASMIPLQVKDLGIDLGDKMESVDNVDGVLDCMNQLIAQKRIEKPEQCEWIVRIVSSIHEVTKQMQELQSKVKDDASYIKQVYDGLGEAGNDREKVREILYDVIRNEHRDPELMKKLRAIVERQLDALPAAKAETEPSPRQIESERVFSGSAFVPKIARGRDEIRSRLASRVPKHLLEGLTDNMLYYISSISDTLDVLGGLSALSNSRSGMLIVHYLREYLDNPNDLLPESRYGVWGYLDDAWLIHNTAYRLVEAGILPGTAFSVDWSAIAAADGVVTSCLPPMVRGQLENYLMQFLNMISSEIAAYNPRFSGGGQDYHPYMGQAGAVGGASDNAGLYADMTDTMCSTILADSMDM